MKEELSGSDFLIYSVYILVIVEGFYFLSSFFFVAPCTVCYCYYFVVLFVCSGQAVHVENPLFTFTIM